MYFPSFKSEHFATTNQDGRKAQETVFIQSSRRTKGMHSLDAQVYVYFTFYWKVSYLGEKQVQTAKIDSLFHFSYHLSCEATSILLADFGKPMSYYSLVPLYQKFYTIYCSNDLPTRPTKVPNHPKCTEYVVIFAKLGENEQLKFRQSYFSHSANAVI